MEVGLKVLRAAVDHHGQVDPERGARAVAGRVARVASSLPFPLPPAVRRCPAEEEHRAALVPLCPDHRPLGPWGPPLSRYPHTRPGRCWPLGTRRWGRDRTRPGWSATGGWLKACRAGVGEGAAATWGEDHLAWRTAPRRRPALSQLHDLLGGWDGERRADLGERQGRGM